MQRDVDWHYELWLAPDPRSAAAVRAFVTRHLHAHDLSHLVEPIRLVASELATNAIVHAGTEFVVTLVERDARIVFSVEDDRPDSLPALSKASATAEHGRGLWLVDVLSEEWGVRSERHGFKGVWAAFTATSDEEPHASSCTCRESHPSAQPVHAPTLRLVH